MQLLEWIAQLLEKIDLPFGPVQNDYIVASGDRVYPRELEKALRFATTVSEVCIVGRVIAEGRLAGTKEVCAVVVPSDALRARFNDDVPGIANAIISEFSQLLMRVPPHKWPSRTFVHLEPLPRVSNRQIDRFQVTDWVAQQGVLTL